MAAASSASARTRLPRLINMDASTFQNLPPEEVARLVRESGPKVCVFPVNGTRRWFMLEHASAGLEREENLAAAYVDVITRRHVELYQLFFDHGVTTLLTPAFGPDLIERGEEYMQMAADGWRRLFTHPDFLDFFRTYQVRVRFYGDYRKFLGRTPYAYLSELFDELTAKTLAYDQRRLFFGVFAHDATETIVELGVRYHAQQGQLPDKRTLIDLYYGEYVEPVDLFIGFDKFSAFDMPLVSTGSEDLYFTISPSPYLTAEQLRSILYDHLYARRGEEPDYSVMTPAAQNQMRNFYQLNCGRTQGIGVNRDGIWYPLPQVISLLDI